MGREWGRVGRESLVVAVVERGVLVEFNLVGGSAMPSRCLKNQRVKVYTETRTAQTQSHR